MPYSTKEVRGGTLPGEGVPSGRGVVSDRRFPRPMGHEPCPAFPRRGVVEYPSGPGYPGGYAIRGPQGGMKPLPSYPFSCHPSCPFPSSLPPSFSCHPLWRYPPSHNSRHRPSHSWENYITHSPGPNSMNGESYQCPGCGKTVPKGKTTTAPECCGTTMVLLPIEECVKPPASAEHARMSDNDAPCDDGRAGP